MKPSNFLDLAIDKRKESEGLYGKAKLLVQTASIELLQEYGPNGKNWAKRQLLSGLKLRDVRGQYDSLGGKEGVGCTWDDLEKKANGPECRDGYSFESTGPSSFVDHQEWLARKRAEEAAIKARSEASSLPPPYTVTDSMPGTSAQGGTEGKRFAAVVIYSC
jgi:hypothetical protein